MFYRASVRVNTDEWFIDMEDHEIIIWNNKDTSTFDGLQEISASPFHNCVWVKVEVEVDDEPD